VNYHDARWPIGDLRPAVGINGAASRLTGNRLRAVLLQNKPRCRRLGFCSKRTVGSTEDIKGKTGAPLPTADFHDQICRCS